MPEQPAISRTSSTVEITFMSFPVFQIGGTALKHLGLFILSDGHYKQMTRGLHVVPVCVKSEGRYKLFKHCLSRYRGNSSSSRIAEGHWVQNAAWTEDMASHKRPQALCGAVIARKWNAMAPWQCALWNNTWLKWTGAMSEVLALHGTPSVRWMTKKWV
jgi:hypothetical protein